MNKATREQLDIWKHNAQTLSKEELERRIKIIDLEEELAKTQALREDCLKIMELVFHPFNYWRAELYSYDIKRLNKEIEELRNTKGNR